jgi:signal transduction histidine kinase
MSPATTAVSSEIPARARTVQRAPAHRAPADAGADGERACRRAWERVRALPPCFWREHPGAGRDDAEPELLLSAGAAALPYQAIARACDRALARGGDAHTPALVLLAALAHERYAGGAAALELAAALRQRGAHAVRVLHAALIAPPGATLRQASALLDTPGLEGAERQLTTLCLAGTAFAAGMPLAELARHLEAARALPAPPGAAAELAARAGLARSLASPQACAAALLDDGAGCGPDTRFGEWLARLQAAWYAGEPALALRAAHRTAALAGPLTPLADRMSYHLFAALAQSAAGRGAALEGLRCHVQALRLLGARCPAGAAAMIELAGALLACHAGDALGALRGFERAAACADRHGQHWVAALACEQAARRSAEAGLATAARHYRDQALAALAQWGALGRIEFLQRGWREPGAPADQRDEDQRLQRAGTIGDLGVSIAHEVNQPLAAIALHAAAARKWLRRPQPDIERALASLSLISAAGRQAGDIVRSVHRLAARQENEFSEVAVDAAVLDALQLLRRPLRKHGVEVDLALGLGACVIRANHVQLQQVLTNLLVNAIEALASPGNGTQERRIRLSSRRYNEHEVEIAVADNGPGIDPRHRDQVFARLFSTKPNSTGMGLSISLSIAHAHGGELAFEPCVPRGACFRLRLPVRHPLYEPAQE